MIEFRSFTRSDWASYAGAESFASNDGTTATADAPLIAEVGLRGLLGSISYDVIVDASGVSIHEHCDGGYRFAIVEILDNRLAALAFARAVVDRLDECSDLASIQGVARECGFNDGRGLEVS